MGLVTFNLAITVDDSFGNVTVDLNRIEALASDEVGSSSPGYAMKTYDCTDGKSKKKVCEIYMNSSGECQGEESSCSSGHTGTGNGYTDDSQCAQPGGHFYDVLGSCFRCGSKKPADSGGSGGSGNNNGGSHTTKGYHEWDFFNYGSYYEYKCKKCKAIFRNTIPPTNGCIM